MTVTNLGLAPERTARWMSRTGGYPPVVSGNVEIPTSEVISVERHSQTAVVWLDRPRARNAFLPEFWDDFPAILDAVSTDPEVRAVVLAGRGPAFTVGLDLDAYGAILGDAATTVTDRIATYRDITRMQRAASALAACPVPVIAAVHGWCIGAGVDLVTACDIRFAAADAVFSVRETRLAMVADLGTLQRLPGIVGPGRAAELIYTGCDVDAAEALEMGLVTRVAGSFDELMTAALATSTQIAANSPLAVRGAKAVLRAGERSGADASLDYVALWNAAFLHSDDLGEAIRAFTERRPPRYQGR